MNCNKIFLRGGGGRSISVGGIVKFKSKLMVQVPIACITDVKDDKQIKKILKEYEVAVKAGLVGSPMAMLGITKEDTAFKILKVEYLLIDTNLLIIGTLRMMKTKYGDRLTRAFKTDVVEVGFSTVFKRDGNKASIFAIYADD